MHISIVVPHGGESPYFVQATGGKFNRNGYTRVISMSDQEPSLLVSARRERAEHIEMFPESFPVGDSWDNGNVETQVGTTQIDSEREYKRKIVQDSNLLPWLIMCASMPRGH